MRNSLAALRLIADGLRDGVVDTSPETGILDQLMLHVRLLEDLRDEQGHPRGTCWGATNQRPVQIGSFLAQWSDAMRPKAAQRGIALRLVVAAALPEVECRRGQVARVVLNLLDNAIRHSPAGTVVVRAAAHPEGCRCSSTTTVPACPRPFALHRSTRCGRRPCPAGRGVGGLAIAKATVDAHGGALWAPVLPRGTSVRFYLPTTARVGA